MEVEVGKAKPRQGKGRQRPGKVTTLRGAGIRGGTDAGEGRRNKAPAGNTKQHTIKAPCLASQQREWLDALRNTQPPDAPRPPHAGLTCNSAARAGVGFKVK